ncbi:MAG: hypothetical protein ACRD1V_03015 [Vicinamibacterales bacterium]
MSHRPAPSSSAPAAQPASANSSDADLPVSLERIQRALSQPAPINLQEQHPIFRLEVFGKKPTIEDLLGEKFWVGPVPYGGMTHQDFMTMTTPKQFQPYAGFTGGYLVAEAALTVAEQWVLKDAIHKYQTSHEERERAAARKEVLDALAALEKARKDAGLDK